MTLGERIQTILKERNIKQVDFAKTLGISANYVNLLANDKKPNMSDTLAKLIEETYGYSVQWLIEGVGEKNIGGNLSACKSEILKKINKMSDSEIKATLAFVKTLESINKDFANELVQESTTATASERKMLSVQEQADLLRARADALEKRNVESTILEKHA